MFVLSGLSEVEELMTKDIYKAAMQNLASGGKGPPVFKIIRDHRSECYDLYPSDIKRLAVDQEQSAYERYLNDTVSGMDLSCLILLSNLLVLFATADH